jgi:UDP-glucose 4-epimerase
MKKKGLKIVITGGAGFIGSHIVEECVTRGYNVVAIDDLSSGDRENIRQFFADISFVKGSVMNQPLLEKAFKNASYVLHQAAIASVQKSILNPVKSHRINTVGALNVFLAARRCGVKRVVYASSSAVYGNATLLPLKENAPLYPLTPYAIQKTTVEMYAKTFSTLYGLETVGLRYFNVFGPRQDPSSSYAAVIPRFIQAIRTEAAPVIYGDGSQTRDFVYVKNVARANLLACSAQDATGEIFNIASGASTSINDLLKKITELVGKNISPRYMPERPGDIFHSSADITRARELLGYDPDINLEVNLKRTIHTFHEKLFL